MGSFSQHFCDGLFPFCKDEILIISGKKKIEPLLLFPYKLQIGLTGIKNFLAKFTFSISEYKFLYTISFLHFARMFRVLFFKA
ncbi:MAG: hypothetical protein EBZ77_06680 [Chitinophagia bacterium]|nr:hypothetical protein [Chitinophagia bacterium]